MCKKVEISDEKWEFIEKIVEAFKPPFIATKSLQTVQLPTSKDTFLKRDTVI